MSITDHTEIIRQTQSYVRPPAPPPSAQDRERAFTATIRAKRLDPGDPEHHGTIIYLAEILSESLRERNQLLRALGVPTPKKESRAIRRMRRQLRGVHAMDVFHVNGQLRTSVMAIEEKLLNPLNPGPDEALLETVIALCVVVFAIEHGITDLRLACTLLSSLVTDGYTIGAQHYADCRYGEYAGSGRLLTHSLPVHTEYADAMVVLLRHLSQLDRQDLANVINSARTRARIAELLSECGFTAERQFEKCANDFKRLLESEICLAVPPPLRGTFSGPATIAALNRDQRTRIHYSTLRIPLDFDETAFEQQCRDAMTGITVCSNGESENSEDCEDSQATREIEYSDNVRRDLAALIHLADEKAGRNAPRFRRVLAMLASEYLDRYADRLELWQYLAVQYLIEIGERGTKQSADDPARGVASTVAQYFAQVGAYLEFVYRDDSVVDNVQMAIQRTRQFLDKLDESRRERAEQPIDYALDLLTAAHDIERAPPYAIYGGRALPSLARNYIANHATFAAVVAVAHREPDPALRFRYVLTLLLMYRCGLRIGETHVLQVQSIVVEFVDADTNSRNTEVRLTVYVRRRGRWRPKSQAGNRPISVAITDATPAELDCLRELSRLRETATDRTAYLFSARSPRKDSATDKTVASHLRTLMKWVARDPDAVLHGFGRKSCINATLASAFGPNPRLPALKALLHPDRLGKRHLPKSIAHGGARHSFLPQAFCSAFGHTSFSDATLPQYGVHQAEFYLECWERRELPRLSRHLATWIAHIYTGDNEIP